MIGLPGSDQEVVHQPAADSVTLTFGNNAKVSHAANALPGWLDQTFHLQPAFHDSETSNGSIERPDLTDGRRHKRQCRLA